METLLRTSDNGSASGPSGWGGNMLSSLAQSDLCRLGVIALLKDIINGNLPERARQLLLASRLVALAKPNGGKYRPIAVGELFYRVAGVIIVRKVTADAAALLAPHQLGVGVRSGAERVVHSLQHSLTDKDTKRALLKVDISNAFNSCDRARVLRQLYEQPASVPCIASLISVMVCPVSCCCSAAKASICCPPTGSGRGSFVCHSLLPLHSRCAGPG